jgi:hypothetical protein
MFRVKTTGTPVPSVDAFSGITLTNTNSAMAVNDPAGKRGYVFQFNGGNT